MPDHPIFDYIRIGSLENVRQQLDRTKRNGSPSVPSDLRDEFGKTTVYYAVFMIIHGEAAPDRIPILQLLLERGQNPNLLVGNLTPLINAINNNRLDLVLLLLNNGADPNFFGATPTFAFAKTPEIALELIRHGADVNMSSVYYPSTLVSHLAEGRLDVAEVLLQHGADIPPEPESVGSPAAQDLVRRYIHRRTELPRRKRVREAGWGARVMGATPGAANLSRTVASFLASHANLAGSPSPAAGFTRSLTRERRRRSRRRQRK